MIPPRTKDSSSWSSKNTFPLNNRYIICNAPFRIDKELLADKSAKIASLLKIKPYEDLTALFQEIPSEPGALELVARFCHGFEVNITTENIVPLICLANHLQMTDSHSPDNLLEKAIKFLKQNILTSWDHIIRSLKASQGPTFQQAVEIGLLNAFVEALTDFALSDPTLLAQPIIIEWANNRPIKKNSSSGNSNAATRRRLFADHSSSSTSSDADSLTEDLTSLPLKLYEPIIEAMAQRGVPQENIAGSLCKYIKKHGNDDKEVIEVVERLLPCNALANRKYPLYPYKLLFEMHGLGVILGAGSNCIASLENRIGKELYRAKTEDLLALDLEVEGLNRILKGFYGNFDDVNAEGLVAVAELMEEYLVEIAKGREIDANVFSEVASMVSSTSSLGSYRWSDGVYRAVDAYLDKHKELVESEREEVCKVLDFQKMSSKAVEHAALSTRLPLRVVMQALFVSQLQLKDNINKAVGGYFGRSSSSVDDGGSRGKEEIVEDEDEKEEINDRGLLVCHEKNCSGRKKKVGLWKGMKRKFGCMGSSSSNDYETLNKCSCQVTNMNKKNKNK